MARRTAPARPGPPGTHAGERPGRRERRLDDAGVLTPGVAEVVALDQTARARTALERGGLRGRPIPAP